MYHGINEQVGPKHPYYETNTAPSRFGEQVSLMKAQGYRSCGVEAALASIEEGEADHHRVVVTFDDGYADLYDNAWPILMEHGFMATVFVVTDLVGVHRYARDGREYLTWAELREMQSQGLQVGSHTVSHRDLQSLSAVELEDEVRRSKEIVEDNLGTAVESFAYPFAFPETQSASTAVLRSMLERHGYRNGVCTILGTADKNSDRYFLPRLPVNTFDDEKLLEAKLCGGYDWMHTLQYGKKVLQSRLAKGEKKTSQASAECAHTKVWGERSI